MIRHTANGNVVDHHGPTADEVLAHQRQQHHDAEARLLDELLHPYVPEPDYGGAFDGVGAVYSDADPGL